MDKQAISWRTVEQVLGASLPLSDRGKQYVVGMMAQGPRFSMIQFVEFSLTDSKKVIPSSC